MVRKRSIHLAWILGGVAVALATNALVLKNPLASLTYRLVATPLLSIESRFPSHRMNELARERDDALGKLANLDVLMRENVALKRQLGVVSHTPGPLIEAHAFMSMRNRLVSTVLINAGKADGVSAGMIVIAAGNILAGRVDEVFTHTSRVILVDDPRVSVSVRFVGASYVAEARGNSRGHLTFSLISHEDNVAEDAMAVSTGLDAFPEGLVVGRVTSIATGTEKLFQDVGGEIAYDPALTSLVFVRP